MTFLFFIGLIFFIIFGFRFLKLYQTYIEYLLTPEEIVEDPETEDPDPEEYEIPFTRKPASKHTEKEIEDLENIKEKYFALLEAQKLVEAE